MAAASVALALDLNIGGNAGVSIDHGGVSVGAGGSAGATVGPGGVNIQGGANVQIPAGQAPAEQLPPSQSQTPPAVPHNESEVKDFIGRLNARELDIFIGNCATVLLTPERFPANYVLVCQLAAKVLDKP